jgi:site-specific DNA-cytosine methylase
MSGGARGRNIMYLLTDHITVEKKLIRTNPRHGKPVDMDGPSRTVKVDGRGGDFCFDTMLLPLDVPATAILGDRRLRPPGHHSTLSEECLVPVGPIKEDAMVQPSATVVADARIYPSGRRGHGSDLEKGVYRRLTVRECMRLQSFPDWWEFPEDVSTSKRYKLVGEAVPPILAYRIAVGLGKVLNISVKEPPRAEDWDLPYFRRAFADYYLNGV